MGDRFVVGLRWCAVHYPQSFVTRRRIKPHFVWSTRQLPKCHALQSRKL